MKKSEILQSKIVDRDRLERLVHLWRFKGYKIVFTNGCFDILHPGHIHLLSSAADLGNILIVGLNSDDSVKRLKGADRPINDERHRAELLASLFYVNSVVVYPEDTPQRLIELVKPDVLVKGGDYEADKIVGADVVKRNGGEVKVIELVQGYSTTSLLEKMQGSND